MRIREMLRARRDSARLAAQLADAEIGFKVALVGARAATGMSQADVAKALGVSRQWVADFEQLESNPPLSAIRYYALAIGAAVEYVVHDDWAKARR